MRLLAARRPFLAPVVRLKERKKKKQKKRKKICISSIIKYI